MPKRIFAASLIILFSLPIVVAAQTASGGGLMVRSSPDGAEATIEGDGVAVTGVTPTLFQHGLVGQYKLKVRRRGYETYTTDVVLDPGRQSELSVALTPKTRLKAAVRSTFIPGWGQRYSEQKTKGRIFNILAVGSLVAFLISDHEFDREFARYETSLARFDQAVADGASRPRLEQLLARLDSDQQRAYDAENARRIVIGSVIAVWGLSLLDALFLFPDVRSDVSIKGVSVSPTTQNGNVGLSLSCGL
jgi:hypothetical protein